MMVKRLLDGRVPVEEDGVVYSPTVAETAKMKEIYESVTMAGELAATSPKVLKRPNGRY